MQGPPQNPYFGLLPEMSSRHICRSKCMLNRQLAMSTMGLVGNAKIPDHQLWSGIFGTPHGNLNPYFGLLPEMSSSTFAGPNVCSTGSLQ